MSITLAIKTLFTSNLSNEWLIGKYAQTNDKRFLAHLYDNCANDLYHYICTHSDPHLGKDICQQTWLKVLEKPHLFQNSGRFIAWLFTVGRNTLIDELRKTNRWESLPEESQQLSSLAFNHREPIADIFDKVLMSLPFEQREAFCLQQEGFGLQEIADITHCGTETAKSRIRYAKQTLRVQLEKYHE